MDPTERMQKAQSAMAEVPSIKFHFLFSTEYSLTFSLQGLLRMIFETTKIQHNGVDQETVRALTSRIDELNEKSATLSAKLEKYQGLTNRLDLAEKWRMQIKEILAETGGELENSANLATNIVTDMVEVLSNLEKFSV